MTANDADITKEVSSYEVAPSSESSEEFTSKRLVELHKKFGSDGGEDEEEIDDGVLAITSSLDKVQTPIPRVDMHLHKVRSPDYFRTQYLGNLGIWTTDQTNRLTLAADVKGKTLNSTGERISAGDRVGRPVTLPSGFKLPGGYGTDSNLVENRNVPAPSSECSVTATPPQFCYPLSSPRPNSSTAEDNPKLASRIHSPGKKAEIAMETEVIEDVDETSTPLEVGDTNILAVVNPDVVSGIIGKSVIEVTAADSVKMSNGRADRDARCLGGAPDATETPSDAPRFGDLGKMHTGRTVDSDNASSHDDILPVERAEDILQNNTFQGESQTAGEVADHEHEGEAGSTESKLSQVTDNLRKWPIDQFGSEATAQPKVFAPSTRAVKPPRRDIRRDYLTNLGMKRAVVAGPGGTRIAPPIMRRDSFHRGSVHHPVEEQLKDPYSGEITFEDLMQVIGSILKGRGVKRDGRKRRCEACERERRSDTGPKTDKLNETDGVGTTCAHKHVEFAPRVSAVYIPVHTEYSDRVRRSYWNSASEIREMVYRNMIEFDAEDYNWQNVAEEEDMYYCEETGEFIHPVFFDADEEAREVSQNVLADGKDEQVSVEYIQEGRKMPIMQRPL